MNPTQCIAGLFAVLLLALGLWFWSRTRSGLVYSIFAIRPQLAARLGLSAPKAVVTTMLFSGAAAGLAGNPSIPHGPVKIVFTCDEEIGRGCDKLDAKLVKCAVLTEATPRGLAEFGQQGKEREALVEKLLADDALMKQMLEAGGAKFSKYGRAVEIYTAIQKVCPKAGEGVLQRLALATSLEHAVPIEQSNAQDQKDAPTVVDPVKRYLHYEKAWLDVIKEESATDPVFKKVADHYLDFRTKYAIWGDAQHMKATYQK